jgi:ribosomal protein S18 acetylase RimI-like enzyme
VSRPELVPFAEEHLDAAAALLTERHRWHREVEPRLPDALDLRAELATLWAKEGASGAFAADGYVLGTRLDDSWGPNVWIEPAGHAVRKPELLRDLYGFASERWVEEGRTSHYAWVPVHDAELVDAWFRVGFGAQHAYGIRELDDEPAVEVPGVVVREAEERDVDAMVAIAPALLEHQARAPVFSTLPQEDEEETRAEIVEELGKPEIGNLVAELDGRVVGNFVVVPVEMSSSHAGLARPPGVAHLGFAATLPEARGAGAGLALTEASFAWARTRGYEAMVTDWRVTNLLSSRFWPKRGFRTTFLRLYRSIP